MLQTILLVAANPSDTAQLRLTQEIREIQIGLKSAPLGGKIQLEAQLAARGSDIRRAMLTHQPAIVHFSGHGEGDAGLIFEDSDGRAAAVSTAALAGFFKLFAAHIRCVVLNACYSEIQADAIAEHIDCVIGMNQAIGDKAAIEFAVAFYDAVGAGRGIEFAYELACNAIQFAGLDEHNTPVLKMRKQRPAARADADYSRFTVFLAETSDDMQGKRQELKAYLEQHAVRVLPQEMYFFPNADALQQTMQADLYASALFVQLLSNANPQRPPGMSTPQGQYDLAVTAGLPILQWRDPNLVADAAPLLALPAVIATSFSEFRQYIKTRLDTLAQQQHRQQNPATTGDGAFVFINIAPEDRSLADEIENLLESQKIYFGLPIFDDDLPALEKIHDLEENLIDSDAVIVVYHRASLSWVREQLRWCRKVRGKRDRPHKLIALCQNEPPERKKAGMTLPNLKVFYCPEFQVPSCLPQVVEALK
ncbi:MAG: CHAT domain-containing protein [Gammaproteobacteria bacterium]|nr:CHAT domain-containing protein [Gammaproteobacteria bacterium]